MPVKQYSVFVTNVLTLHYGVSSGTIPEAIPTLLYN